MEEKDNKKTPNASEKNVEFYNILRNVPQEAKKTISEGRLRGKTDINPMWRIKALTEGFGPCGIGWKIEITNKWLEAGNADTTVAFVDLNLYVRDPKTGQWSDPIPGNGGNIFKRKEGSGKDYVDDDSYKKAISDAIGSAAKLLGVGADVYWESDATKYTAAGSSTGTTATTENKPKKTLTPQSSNWASNVAKVAGSSDSPEKLRERISKVYIISDEDFKALLKAAGKAA